MNEASCFRRAMNHLYPGRAGQYSDLYRCEAFRLCADLRACCVDHVCFLMWEDECEAQEHPEGEQGWHPDYTACTDPDPCTEVSISVPSWGRLKTLYRG